MVLLRLRRIGHSLRPCESTTREQAGAEQAEIEPAHPDGGLHGIFSRYQLRDGMAEGPTSIIIGTDLGDVEDFAQKEE